MVFLLYMCHLLCFVVYVLLAVFVAWCATKQQFMMISNTIYDAITDQQVERMKQSHSYNIYDAITDQ